LLGRNAGYEKNIALKTLPSAFAAHLAGGATTLCYCWRIARRDGLVLGFTEHDENVVYAGTTFQASSGFTAPQIQQCLGLSVDNFTASSALSSLSITETDLLAGRYDDATVELVWVNWANSRRHYDASHGIKPYSQLENVLAFFEERRGRLYGFRWRDWLDYRSSTAAAPIAATDQSLGTGDGATTVFQLKKTYGSLHAPWARIINKPVAGSVAVALGGVPQAAGWSVDATTGLLTFGVAPAIGVAVTAGFEFDVPARFDTDQIEVDLDHFQIGSIQSIPVVEVRV
jgi:uncharacterized protein (TIGR02217 family)